MPLHDKYSEDEKDFIENALRNRKNVEIKTTDDDLIVEKKVQSKKNKNKRKVPGYKNISHWIAAFLLLPVLLTGIFMAFLIRAESFVGKDALKWLSSTPLDPSFKNIAEQAGFGWLPNFLYVYEHRWIIIIIIFTICFLISGLLMYIDYQKLNKTKNDDEMSDDNE